MSMSQESLTCARIRRTVLKCKLQTYFAMTPKQEPSQAASADTGLINAWLTSEGDAFLRLGAIVSDSIESGEISLQVDAIDTILVAFEEMLSSYAYSQDEGLHLLVIAFMTAIQRTALAASSQIVAEQVVPLARFLVGKTVKNQMPSWRVRLAIVRFLEVYTIHDNSNRIWLGVDDDLDVPLPIGFLDRMPEGCRCASAIPGCDRGSSTVRIERSLD